jgi:hypothetical protein
MKQGIIHPVPRTRKNAYSDSRDATIRISSPGLTFLHTSAALISVPDDKFATPFQTHGDGEARFTNPKSKI